MVTAVEKQEAAELYRGRAAEILLVDDSRGDALLAVHAFRDARITTEVTIASTGEMALEILRQEGEYKGKMLPDLVLLDLRLPRMSGLDVLIAIKGDTRLRHIPVIVMSGSGAGNNVMGCYQHHANAYLIKPSNMVEYRAAMTLVEQFFFVMAALPAANDG